MKKILEIIALVIIETLMVLFINFDKSVIVLLWVGIFAYIAVKKFFPQSAEMSVAQNHRMSSSQNQPIPNMTLSSDKNFNNQVRSNTSDLDKIDVKWLYLIITLINIGFLVLIMKNIITL